MSKKLDILRYLTAGVFRLKVSLKVVQSDLINTPSYKSRLMRSLPDFSVNMLVFLHLVKNVGDTVSLLRPLFYSINQQCH